jgi:DNA-directed RNA polymerase specialized sigma24 family protein
MSAHILVQRSTSHGVAMSTAEAERLLSTLDLLAALRVVEGACGIVRVAWSEQRVELDFSSALRYLRACGGDADQAKARLLWRPSDARPGTPEVTRRARVRGIDLEPERIDTLVKRRGVEGALRYVDKVHAVLEATRELGIECAQTLAIWRLSRAKERPTAVIASFAAEQRRRVDRLTAPCGVKVPPRGFRERANVHAECGCPSCSNRLTSHMQRYIGKMLANPFFADLDDAWSEAHHALADAIDQWPGGENFAGWFSVFFKNRVRGIYATRAPEERTMVSLDAPADPFDERGHRMVSPIDRLADRSVDPAPIVVRKITIEDSVGEKRREREERVAAYELRRRRAA